MNNLYVWCYVLGKDVTLWFIKHTICKLRSWGHQIKTVCDNLNFTFVWPNSVIILMDDENKNIKCTVGGTDNGYFVASIGQRI